MEWQGAITGAVAALVGRILFDWLQPRKTANGAGSKPVEFWHQNIRQAMREELDAFEDRRDSTIRNIVRQELDAVIRNEFERDPRKRRG